MGEGKNKKKLFRMGKMGTKMKAPHYDQDQDKNESKQ
jgi:hypothetical protein